MAYFTGTLLDRKVDEYDLSIIDAKLASLADGTDDTWPPGGYIVEAQPTILEATRIVLYSMLHNYRLKPRFTVRIDYEGSVIKIDLKAPARGSTGLANTGVKRRHGDIAIASGSTHSSYRQSLQDVPAVPENLDNLWDENITLDTPVGALHTGTEKEEA